MKIQISNCRVSFANGLYRASAFEEGQTPKYGADFILTDRSEVFEVHRDANGKIIRKKTTMEDAMLAVANEAWKGKGKAVIDDLESSKKCYRNGDKRINASGEVYDGYAGRWYVTAKSTTRVPLFDAQGNAVTEEDGVIYSGCYVHVSFDLYANTNPKTRGIFAGLTGVRFAGDGDSFGGSAKATADDFAGLADVPSDDDLV